MTVDGELAKRLLSELPDIPRWVETRSPLLHGDCELLGYRESPLAFVVVDRASRLASIAGEPPEEAVREAVEIVGQKGDVLAQNDNRDYVSGVLSGWWPETAKLHLLADESKLREAALPRAVSVSREEQLFYRPSILDEGMRRAEMRVVTSVMLSEMEGLSDDLREELSRALLRWLVVAAYTETGRLASVCYAGAPTESLWDVAIETLEPYRRMGYGSAAVLYLTDLMWEKRKRPVWGALESNAASLALAGKLGFREVDTIIVMQPPEI